MLVYLSPSRLDTSLAAYVSGDTITINGELFDFSPLREGDELPATAVNSSWLIGNISRLDGNIVLTLVLPHGAEAPEETRFPTASVTPIEVTSGLVPVPPYNNLAT